MRLLHTADWHLGRTLEGRSRQREQEAVMDEIVMIAKEEQADAVLMAGDVFDSFNPPAQSEILYYETIERLSEGGSRPVIVIAGNHDSPDRIRAAWPLARNSGIYLAGQPGLDVVRPELAQSPYELIISALPYPSETRLNEVLSEWEDEESLRSAYNERIKNIWCEHAANFKPGAVNVMMSHLFLAGGKESDSERPIQVGGAYTVSVNDLPDTAQYLALGHLHRPQNISGGNCPARYSGSPLAYSFSESGVAKSVTMVDIEPGKAPVLNNIYLSSGKPLVRWRATEGIQEVYKWFDEARDENAWVDLEIYLNDVPSHSDIQTIKGGHPGIINIRPVFPEQQEAADENRGSRLPVDQLFRKFYEKQTNGAVPEDRLVDLFMGLVHEQEEEEKDETSPIDR